MNRMNQESKRVMTALASASLLAWLPPALAQKAQTEPMPKTTATLQSPVAVGSTSTITGQVTSINLARRVLTVQGEQGAVMELIVGPEVKNLAEVKLGDRVNVQYTEATALALIENPGHANDLGALRTKVETVATSRPDGSKPGGGVAEHTTMIANVFEVNRERGTLTLRGTNGEPMMVQVPDRQTLQQIDRNDQVVMSFVEAAAVSIKPATAN